MKTGYKAEQTIAKRLPMTPKRIPIFCGGRVLSTAGLGFLILALALAGCSRPQSVAHAFPPPTVTESKPMQKVVVNWSGSTGRKAAVQCTGRLTIGSQLKPN